MRVLVDNDSRWSLQILLNVCFMLMLLSWSWYPVHCLNLT